MKSQWSLLGRVCSRPKCRRADDSYRKNSEGSSRFRVNSQTNLAADLRTRGCAVCNYVINTARDFFAQWQYALSSTKEAQESFAAELGFCPLHSWQLHSMSSPWGESAGLAILAEEISNLLVKAANDDASASTLRTIPRTRKDCRVCRMLTEEESDYIGRLGSFVSDKLGRRNYERSQGVCMYHLACLLSVVSHATREFLLATASRPFQEMAQQMRQYVAKRDALRRDLISRDEEDAHLRVLTHLVGAKDCNRP
ncbi:MAG: hypothetical protein DME75_04330 [Verrucomicrobia bacterium]|nr:MAG: hypothetical protein DME75_04330 [Verrucomicrobiota bacterium]